MLFLLQLPYKPHTQKVRDEKNETAQKNGAQSILKRFKPENFLNTRQHRKSPRGKASQNKQTDRKPLDMDHYTLLLCATNIAGTISAARKCVNGIYNMHAPRYADLYNQDARAYLGVFVLRALL